jgi:hypothetical protein
VRWKGEKLVFWVPPDVSVLTPYLQLPWCWGGAPSAELPAANSLYVAGKRNAVNTSHTEIPPVSSWMRKRHGNVDQYPPRPHHGDAGPKACTITNGIEFVQIMSETTCRRWTKAPETPSRSSPPPGPAALKVDLALKVFHP